MKPSTARRILTRWMHWTMMNEELPPERKLVLVGAPHTSIWDFVVAWLCYRAMGGHPRVMIKKEFFFWPLGALLRSLGAIPVDRSRPLGITRQIIDVMARSDEFALCIAPEGTRKPVKRWKTGFHTIARATGVPVYLGYFDWGRKEIGYGPRLTCTDDAIADLRTVQQFYKDKGVSGKYPDCVDYLD